MEHCLNGKIQNFFGNTESLDRFATSIIVDIRWGYAQIQISLFYIVFTSSYIWRSHIFLSTLVRSEKLLVELAVPRNELSRKSKSKIWCIWKIAQNFEKSSPEVNVWNDMRFSDSGNILQAESDNKPWFTSWNNMKQENPYLHTKPWLVTHLLRQKNYTTSLLWARFHKTGLWMWKSNVVSTSKSHNIETVIFHFLLWYTFLWLKLKWIRKKHQSIKQVNYSVLQPITAFGRIW